MTVNTSEASPNVQVPRRSALNHGSKNMVRRILVFGASVLVILAGWEIASRAYNVPFIFPGPSAVWDALIANLSNGSLVEATSASLMRIIAGFTIGTVAGVVLGLLFGASRIFLGMSMPFVTFFRFVPPLAWFAPALVWFGAGETSKIVLVMYTSIFVVALSTLEARKSIAVDLQRMASTSGVTWWQRMTWVTFPASIPYIVAGARIAMGNAFMTVVSAEMLGAQDGLGVMINNGMITTNVPPVFVSIIVLGSLGLLADRVFVYAINTWGKKFQSGETGAVA